MGEARKAIGASNEFGLNRRAFVIDTPPPKKVASIALDNAVDQGSIGEIKERFVDAMAVLRRMPVPSEYLALKGARSSLPDFVRTSSELAGGEPDEDIRIRPMQREIAQLDEVLGWLFWIDDPFTAKCLLARGAGVPWKILQQIDPRHRSRVSLNGLLNDAYRIILCRLNEKTQNSALQTLQI